jgi:hypothetical protein
MPIIFDPSPEAKAALAAATARVRATLDAAGFQDMTIGDDSYNHADQGRTYIDPIGPDRGSERVIDALVAAFGPDSVDSVIHEDHRFISVVHHDLTGNPKW